MSVEILPPQRFSDLKMWLKEKPEETEALKYFIDKLILYNFNKFTGHAARGAIAVIGNTRFFKFIPIGEVDLTEYVNRILQDKNVKYNVDMENNIYIPYDSIKFLSYDTSMMN